MEVAVSAYLIVRRKHWLTSRTPPHVDSKGVVPELLTYGGRTDGQRYAGRSRIKGLEMSDGESRLGGLMDV